MDFFVEHTYRNVILFLMQLKYSGAILLDVLLAGICKAITLATAFISLATDWLHHREQRYEYCGHYLLWQC